MLSQNTNALCLGCGYRYSDFLRSGYLGCATCYQSFALKLEAAMEKYHKVIPGAKPFSPSYNPSQSTKQYSQALCSYVLHQKPLKTKIEPTMKHKYQGMRKMNDELSCLSRLPFTQRETKRFYASDQNISQLKCQNHTIIESVRLRLARNVHGLPYLNYLQSQHKQRLQAALLMPEGPLSLFHCFPNSSAYTVTTKDEDHLRISCIFPWRDPIETVEQIFIHLQELATIDKLYHWQFHPDYGFLTACPGLGGQGLRLSFQLRIPALLATKNWLLWKRNLTRAGYEVRKNKQELLPNYTFLKSAKMSGQNGVTNSFCKSRTRNLPSKPDSLLTNKEDANLGCNDRIQISNRHWPLTVNNKMEISHFLAILARLEGAEKQAA